MINGRIPELTIKFTERPQNVPTEGKKATIEIKGENDIYESTSLDKGKRTPPMSMIQTFNRDGKTNLKIDPFLDATNAYDCAGNKLTINKIVPTNLNLIRLSATEMVYLEEGTEQYFYFHK